MTQTPEPRHLPARQVPPGQGRTGWWWSCAVVPAIVVQPPATWDVAAVASWFCAVAQAARQTAACSRRR